MNDENENPIIPKQLMHNGKRPRSNSFLDTSTSAMSIKPAKPDKPTVNDEHNSPIFTACVKRANATGILKDLPAINNKIDSTPRKQVRFNIF